MVHELQQRMALVQFLEESAEKMDENIIRNYQIEEEMEKEMVRIRYLQEELKSCSGSGELFLLISRDLGGGQTTKITVGDLCSINPQSPNSCFPLAEMHAKDTHENLSKAFSCYRVRK